MLKWNHKQKYILTESTRHICDIKHYIPIKSWKRVNVREHEIAANTAVIQIYLWWIKEREK